MQTKDNTETCCRRRKQSTRRKTFPQPSKLLLPTDFLESSLHQLSRSHNSARLHPPLNGFFQYLPKAPTLLSTLRVGEVSVWAKNLSKMCRWKCKSRWKLQKNDVKDCKKNNSNSQVFGQGFSLKSFFRKYSLSLSFIFFIFIFTFRE